MITEFFPSQKRINSEKLRKPYATGVYISKADEDKAKALNITVDEYKRRCKAVLEENLKHRFTVGQLVQPTWISVRQKTPVYRIVGIVRTYDQYGTCDWHDPPYVLSIVPQDGGDTIVCTQGYVEPLPMESC